MGSKSFQFKFFSVVHERCAMKVGTDGVLLGAWAPGGQHILDVGCGSGLIALMMAQRFPNARVTAIDVDRGAFEQSFYNISQSPFNQRIKVEFKSLQKWAKTAARGSVDVMVSNPPYFAESLKNPNPQRALARHTDTLSYVDLAAAAHHVLTESGTLSVILPVNMLSSFEGALCDNELFIHRLCMVRTVVGKLPKRCLLTCGKHPISSPERTEEFLTASDGSRSAWYAELTKGFYTR